MKPPPSRGFTLIELMMAVAIAAILLALAGPSFQSAMNGNRLSGAASELIAAVQLARAEAVRTNRNTTLCRSDDGSSCSAASRTWPGWIVFVDTDADGVRDGTEPVVKAGTFDAPVTALSSPAVNTLGERITFRGDGTARASGGLTLLVGALAVCIPTAQPAENVRTVGIASGTRTAVRRRNGAGACATPADS